VMSLCCQERRRRGDANMQLFLGDVFAVQGKFTDAARIYKKIGQQSRAMSMYTDLRMFDLAKVFMQVLKPSPPIKAYFFVYF